MSSMGNLVEMSRRYGADERFVLGGGGNSSYKENGVMYVKASGSQLGTIEPKHFVAMDVAALKAMLEKDYPADDDARELAALDDMMAARLEPEAGLRPSVEAILHALFPQRFVLHVHPALVNGLSCGCDGETRCETLFGGEAVWVPLTKPGYILAKGCDEAFRTHKNDTGHEAQVVVLQNHGLFVAADSVEEIDALAGQLMAKLESALVRKPDFGAIEFDHEAASAIAAVLRGLYSPEGKSDVQFFTNAEIGARVADAEAFAPLREPFTPDHIVYARDNPLFVEADADFAAAFAAFVTKKGFAPKIVAVRGLGCFALGADEKEASLARALFLDAACIACYAESFGGYLPLPRAFTDFILTWEVERYRQSVSLA